MHIKGKKKVLNSENLGNFINLKKIQKDRSILNLSPVPNDYNNYGDSHFVPSFKNKSIKRI